MTFGLLVHDLRTAAGVSQSEVARRLSTSQATINRLERGVGDPKLSTIERVSRALGYRLVIELCEAADSDPSSRAAAG